jgi:hypothetical protein
LGQNGAGDLGDPRVERQIERKDPQRGEVGVGVMPVEHYAKMDQLATHELLGSRQATRQQDLDSAPWPDGEKVQHLQCSWRSTRDADGNIRMEKDFMLHYNLSVHEVPIYGAGVQLVDGGAARLAMSTRT